MPAPLAAKQSTAKQFTHRRPHVLHESTHPVILPPFFPVKSPVITYPLISCHPIYTSPVTSSLLHLPVIGSHIKRNLITLVSLISITSINLFPICLVLPIPIILVNSIAIHLVLQLSICLVYSVSLILVCSISISLILQLPINLVLSITIILVYPITISLVRSISLILVNSIAIRLVYSVPFFLVQPITFFLIESITFFLIHPTVFFLLQPLPFFFLYSFSFFPFLLCFIFVFFPTTIFPLPRSSIMLFSLSLQIPRSHPPFLILPIGLFSTPDLLVFPNPKLPRTTMIVLGISPAPLITPGAAVRPTHNLVAELVLFTRTHACRFILFQATHSLKMTSLCISIVIHPRSVSQPHVSAPLVHRRPVTPSPRRSPEYPPSAAERSL